VSIVNSPSTADTGGAESGKKTCFGVFGVKTTPPNNTFDYIL